MTQISESPWHLNSAMQTSYTKLQVGTCHGLVDLQGSIVRLIAVANDEPHNGDFQKFMDNLEHRGKNIVVEELWNKNLRRHLIEKRGYKPCKKNGNKRVIKVIAG